MRYKSSDAVTSVGQTFAISYLDHPGAKIMASPVAVKSSSAYFIGLSKSEVQILIMTGKKNR